MAKSNSRSTFFATSAPPQKGATRLAEPERWDTPFSREMTDEEVDAVLAHRLFATTRAERFPQRIPLRGVLKNDTRIRDFLPGEIIVRQGDYGHSAFIILQGGVRVFLKEPSDELLGRRPPVRASIWGSFKRWLNQPHFPEQSTGPGGVGGRVGESRIFLQDIPGVLDSDRTVLLQAGELFGEIAALGRTPRTATVVADGPAKLLEIRWQGLRELRNYAPEWKQEIDQRYRQRSLLRHLQETPLFFNLDADTLQRVADATRFETAGEFDWHSAYNRSGDRERREHETQIARQGDYPSGLLLVRSGFARVSSDYNHGERTNSYLGKGQSFGLPEIVAGWRGQRPVPLTHSLHALGYTDLLFIPATVLEQYVFPRLTTSQLEQLNQKAAREAGVRPATARIDPDEQNLLEFVVAGRFINGRSTMLIDLDRCTRCDDCVRACAATHDNNPRFIRQGPESTGVMVASACMHCVDPVCMIGCPTGAIQRSSAQGEVVINPDTCIGCSICAQSCPYGTIQMVVLHDAEGQPVVTEETGAPIRRATKCDLCIDQPGGPACVSACPHDALVRADMREVATLAEWLRR